MKLEVGMYVRTFEGEITKIEKLTLPEEPSDCLFVKFENEPYSFKYKPWETIDFKSSHNIIDLIEVGDYVNGCRVIKNTLKDGGNIVIVQGGNCFTNEDIKSIVTHEQFSAMEYKVESEVK